MIRHSPLEADCQDEPWHAYFYPEFLDTRKLIKLWWEELFSGDHSRRDSIFDELILHELQLPSVQKLTVDSVVSYDITPEKLDSLLNEKKACGVLFYCIVEDRLHVLGTYLTWSKPPATARSQKRDSPLLLGSLRRRKADAFYSENTHIGSLYLKHEGREKSTLSNTVALLDHSYKIHVDDSNGDYDFTPYLEAMLELASLYEYVFDLSKGSNIRDVDFYISASASDPEKYSEAMEKVEALQKKTPILQWEWSTSRMTNTDMDGLYNNLNRTAMAQFVLGRMSSRDSYLLYYLNRGFAVWYTYCLKYKFPLESDFLRLLQASTPLNAESNYCQSFEDQIGSVQMMKISDFRKKLGDDSYNFVIKEHRLKEPGLPLPTLLLKVPFTDALSLVSQRCCILKNGYAYVPYTSAHTWLLNRWKAGKLHKNETSETQRIYIQEWERFIGPRLMKSWQEGLKTKFDKRMRIRESREEKEARVQLIKKDVQKASRKFETSVRKIPYIKLPSVGPAPPLSASESEKRAYLRRKKLISEARVHDRRIFAKTALSWNKIRNRILLRNSREREEEAILFTKELPPPSKVAQQKEYRKLDPFLELYGHMLPPCIRGILVRHFKSNTHMKYEERMVVFTYLAHVRIPLSESQDMWYRMCLADHNMEKSQKDTLISRNLFERGELGIQPEGLYKFRNDVEQDPSYNKGFSSCSTIRSKGADFCPFSDIEDLATAKASCGSREWEDFGRRGESRWPGKYWSPGVIWKQKLYWGNKNLQ